MNNRDRAGETLKTAFKLNLNKDQVFRESPDSLSLLRFKNKSSSSELTIKATKFDKSASISLYRVDKKLRQTLKKIGTSALDTLKPKKRNRFLDEINLSFSGKKKNGVYSAELPEKGVYFISISSTSTRKKAYRLKLGIDPITVDGDTPPDGGSTPTDTPSDGNSGGSTTNNGSSNTSSSWTRQLGSSSNDYGYSTAVDTSGNVYVAGTTDGTLEGSSGGNQDNFVAKYDATGQLLWTRQFSVNEQQPDYSDTIFDIAVDSAGNYYIAGLTTNVSSDFSPTGLGDVEEVDADGFVAKYDSNGNQLWSNVIETASDTREYSFLGGFLTANIHKFDAASSLSIGPDGSIYVGGFVEAIPAVTYSGFSIESNASNGFIAKFNSSTGQRNWLTTVGGNQSDAVSDIAVDDNGNIYVTGIQDASLLEVDLDSGDSFSADLSTPFTGGDAWVAKYSGTGTTNASLLWSDTLASTNNQQDYARAIAIDGSGNAYITGDTLGTLPTQTAAGNTDGFVSKYDTNGSRQWVNQFGTSAKEQSQAIAVDSQGKIYVSGESGGSLYGTNLGSDDIWIATYDSTGALTGSTQLGTSRAEEIYRAWVDSADNTYFVGQAFGDLAEAGANQGQFDVVILKNPPV